MGKVKHGGKGRESGPVTIGRAAAAVGLSPKAIRLYEARGLLPTPERTAAGYRLYTDADMERLSFIASARQLGLHVDQVAEILTAAQDGERPCGTTSQLLARRIAEIDRAIAQLSALRSALAEAREGVPDEEAAICPMLERSRSP